MKLRSRVATKAGESDAALSTQSQAQPGVATGNQSSAAEEPKNKGKAKKATTKKASKAPGSKMSASRVKKTSPKKNARPKRKNPYSEENLTQSSDSRYLNADLVKLFANPNAWNCLDLADQQEILSLLPEHIHPNPDPDPAYGGKIAPLPENFVRYSTDWRDGVRLYQEDLLNGHYDPEWQRQAAAAMEKRAAGEFDKYKETQFEEFWGQKQKVFWAGVAGDSAKIKLEELVQEGVIKIGDVWKFQRTVGKKEEDRIFFEKEIKIVGIDDDFSLKVLIPGPGRVVLAVGMEDEVEEIDGKNVSEEMRVDVASRSVEDEEALGDYDSTHDQLGNGNDSGSAAVEIEQAHQDTQESLPPSSTATPGIFPSQSSYDQKSADAGIDFTSDSLPSSPLSDPPDSEPPSPKPETTNAPVLKVVRVDKIKTARMLETTILEIEGHPELTGGANAWKLFRCLRNNQDMGALWEVRQEWYEKQQKRMNGAISS